MGAGISAPIVFTEAAGAGSVSTLRFLFGLLKPRPLWRLPPIGDKVQCLCDGAGCSQRHSAEETRQTPCMGHGAGSSTSSFTSICVSEGQPSAVKP